MWNITSIFSNLEERLNVLLIGGRRGGIRILVSKLVLIIESLSERVRLWLRLLVVLFKLSEELLRGEAAVILLLLPFISSSHSLRVACELLLLLQLIVLSPIGWYVDVLVKQGFLGCLLMHVVILKDLVSDLALILLVYIAFFVAG